MTELLRESIAQADREEFIEEEEMDARIERMLCSCAYPCKGRVRSRRIPHRHPQNIAIVDPHQPDLAKGIVSKAAPAPCSGSKTNPRFTGLPCILKQFFDSLTLRPNIEIVKARLPEGHWFWILVSRPLQKAQGAGHPWTTALPVPWHNSLRKPLLNTLHRGRRCPHLRLTHEQVKVLRHHDVSQHNKAMLFAHFFKNVQKQITAVIGVEPTLSLIATAGDEVKISGTVVTPQTLGHERRLNPVRPERCDGQPHPPLAKNARSGAPGGSPKPFDWHSLGG